MPKCLRCGGEDLFTADKVYVLGSGASEKPLVVSTSGDPGALILTERQEADVVADVCARCGHVELKVANPMPLFLAWQKANSKKA